MVKIKKGNMLKLLLSTKEGKKGEEGKGKKEFKG